MHSHTLEHFKRSTDLMVRFGKPVAFTSDKGATTADRSIKKWKIKRKTLTSSMVRQLRSFCITWSS